MSCAHEVDVAVLCRLKPDFDESGYTGPQKVILAALNRHGMLLSDGGEIALTLADDRTSTAKWADLGIPLTYDCARNP